MIATKPTLHLLFEADFSNGTTYSQGADDESLLVEGKSAFYDVVQRLPEVLRFRLMCGDACVMEVDLLTGLFNTGGLPFAIHPQSFVATERIKLVYERNTVVETLGEASLEGTIHLLSAPSKHYVASYVVGWEAPGLDGKVQRFAVTLDGAFFNE